MVDGAPPPGGSRADTSALRTNRLQAGLGAPLGWDSAPSALFRVAIDTPPRLTDDTPQSLLDECQYGH